MDQRLSDDSRDLSNCSKVGGCLPKYSSCCWDTCSIVLHSLTSLIKYCLEIGYSQNQGFCISVVYYCLVFQCVCFFIFCLSRNTGQGMGSTSSRVGGILAPYIALMVSNESEVILCHEHSLINEVAVNF